MLANRVTPIIRRKAGRMGITVALRILQFGQAPSGFTTLSIGFGLAKTGVGTDGVALRAFAPMVKAALVIVRATMTPGGWGEERTAPQAADAVRSSPRRTAWRYPVGRNHDPSRRGKPAGRGRQS